MDVTPTTPRAEVLRNRYRSRLPERLEDLAGPVEGVVDLPPHIVWPGRTGYSLDRPKSRMTPYRTVLTKACAKTWPPICTTSCSASSGRYCVA